MAKKFRDISASAVNGLELLHDPRRDAVNHLRLVEHGDYHLHVLLVVLPLQGELVADLEDHVRVAPRRGEGTVLDEEVLREGVLVAPSRNQGSR
jgi:hypothetical protein